MATPMRQYPISEFRLAQYRDPYQVMKGLVWVVEGEVGVAHVLVVASHLYGATNMGPSQANPPSTLSLPSNCVLG